MDELKTAPRGYAKDHPRIELLRRKGLMASRQFPVEAWMGTKRAVTKLRATWAAIAAAVRLARHPRRPEHPPARRVPLLTSEFGARRRGRTRHGTRLVDAAGAGRLTECQA